MKPTASQERAASEHLAAKQMTIDGYLATKPKEARGVTCEAQDVPRLNDQAMRVYRVMRFLGTHTLRQLSAITGDPEASISARIREIRAYLHEGDKGTIIRERVPNGNGLHTYSMRIHKYPGAA